MSRRHFLGAVAVLFLHASVSLGQANGKLQIHFMDVGQGDGAVLVSPGGEVVLFDNGLRNNCDKPLSYLQQLGITKVDYHVASHYHDDHIGCTTEVLQQFPLQQQAIDRGGTYHTNKYKDYVTAVGSQRRTAIQGTTITLDATSANPVRITVAALNGNGVQTTNENDLSVVAVVRFGSFDAVIGGDLSGYQNTNYEDIETSGGCGSWPSGSLQSPSSRQCIQLKRHLALDREAESGHCVHGNWEHL
jgi:beta-lactamase superfamily II metal-dependent hydrolase